MQRSIYYTDKIMGKGYSLYLDLISEQEYFLDDHGYLWESQQAADTLINLFK